jgi:Concanavalin A-like lectin/glucanases superfamily
MNAKVFRPARRLVLSLVAMLVAAPAAWAVSLNYAAAFRWHGYMDTNLAFSEFMGADHTVTAWFMPQYPNGYIGPVVTVNGTGNYFIGQGNYETGVVGAKLRVVVGDAEAHYTLPTSFSDNVSYLGRWQHVALVRKKTIQGGFWSTKVVLYLNGARKEKDGGGDLTIGSTLFYNSSLPQGTLRLGASDPDPATAKSQFYGFVDDVAVFDRALTESEIMDLYHAKRLTGSEADLLAGYTFDTLTPAGHPLPVALGRPVTVVAPAYKALVSQTRLNTTDAPNLPFPSQAKTLQLPFIIGQVWKVAQGYGGTISHNGTAVFSYDFALAGVDGNDQPVDLPDASSAGQPLLSATDGTVTEYFDPGDLDPSDGDDQDYYNYLYLQTAPNERLTYLHIQSGSPSQALMSYGPPPFAIEADTHLADVGYGNGYHLHLSGTSGSGVTHPRGFSNYEYYDPVNQAWYYVSWQQKRVPRQGQYIRRPYLF